MATESIRISAVIPAAPEQLYAAWLDGEQHGEFTGGAASVEPRVGGRHTAWDGYIEGQILELQPSSRILQTWRSLDFPQDAPDSRLEILFATAPGGAEITLVHTDIPEGQGADYEEGWVEHYFKPMQRHYGRPPANDLAGDGATTSPLRETAPPAAPRTSPPKRAASKQKAAAHKAKKPAPAKRTKVAASKTPAKRKPVAAKKKAVAAKKKPAVAKKKAAAAKKKPAAAKKKPAAAKKKPAAAKKKSGKKR